MRAIIIEDEPLSVAELRTTLAEVAPQIEVVATASSVAEAAAVIAGVGHDLIFMDIHLGDGSGFDIFQRTEISVPVIFITAYDSYALKAFENKGIDYRGGEARLRSTEPRRRRHRFTRNGSWYTWAPG